MEIWHPPNAHQDNGSTLPFWESLILSNFEPLPEKFPGWINLNAELQRKILGGILSFYRLTLN